MRKPSSKDQLTPKEEELMHLLWNYGPIQISRLLELYPEPRPHFNTVSTVMRRLEAKGLVDHSETGGSFHYFATARKEDFMRKGLSEFISKYFGGSYFGAVSALVAEEKISAEELDELLDLVKNKRK